MQKPHQHSGGRLQQNHIKVQQLKNGQYILTLPRMWATLLDVDKGEAITFMPGKQGGIEILKVEKKGEKK